jgi:hypothetical protein
VEFLKDEPSETLVEFVDITTKTEKTKENYDNNIKNGLQNKVVIVKNAKIKERKNSRKRQKKKTTKKTRIKNLILNAAQQMLP